MENKVIVCAENICDNKKAQELANKLNLVYKDEMPDEDYDGLALVMTANGLSLNGQGQSMQGDFTRMLKRISRSNLPRELLVKSAKIKGAGFPLTAVDATAGLGEDAFLLAATGFNVKLYERDPIISALLQDALNRAKENPELSEIANRMELFETDSITALSGLEYQPDVILLDPMFPARQKSALIKKKFQLLHQLEKPCPDEEKLLDSALKCCPRKLIIKRPIKGPFLADRKPDYSIKGKAIRFDCIVFAVSNDTK